MLADTAVLEPPPPSPLYRQFFTHEEIRELNRTPLESAVSEIAMLRVLITRVLAAAASGERASSEHRRSPRHEARGSKAKLTLESRLRMLAAFCQAAATIASLARLEFKRRGPPPSLLELIMAPIADEPL